MEVSPDHRYLAYSTDTVGTEHFTLVIKDLKTGAILRESMSNTSPDVEWAEDGTTLDRLLLTLDNEYNPSRVNGGKGPDAKRR